jgi:hypothetical protein
LTDKGFTLALSVAGHDKGRLYIVLERNETSVLLADGKRRKISAPKRKNIKHVIFLPNISADGGTETLQATDAGLRRLIAAEQRRRLLIEKAEKDQGGTYIG